MFNRDFFPTPENVIYQMLHGFDVHGKVVLEPSAGKGDIVDVLKREGAAEVLACEKNTDLAKIVASKCKILCPDFLQVTSDQISHIDFIIMNPPFTGDEKHILHAWEIAPAGCQIIALCNIDTLKNRYSSYRERFGKVVEENGSYESLGNCFDAADRTTTVEIALVRMQKPANEYDAEFNGFFMGEDAPEQQENALMSYNVVRDLVNRYVAAVKLYDQQLELGVKMNELTAEYFFSNKPELTMSVARLSVPVQRSDFKKSMQKAGWLFIFDKMNMKKYATQGLKEDINKFVEKQTAIPFTMRNIYTMLQIVIGTQEQRMDKAILEVFEKLTKHYDDNRYSLEGWKTNSHYLLNRRFILPYMVEHGWGSNGGPSPKHGGNFDMVEDFLKALCYISGENYDSFRTLYDTMRNQYALVDSTGKLVMEDKYGDGRKFPVSEYEMSKIEYEQQKRPGTTIEKQNVEWGSWFEWAYFKVKVYKKGTAHIEFKSEELWARLNQRIAKLKGYPLPEFKKTKETDKRNAATAKNYRPPVAPAGKFTVLFEM